jgi:lambda family phage tail tape measure protein
MKANQAVQTLLASLLKVAAESILTKLFASSSKGSFGDLLVKSFAASGNVYGPAGVIPFANGGVVGGPTLFPFANGIGLMGEAGPEAVMPLQRDASGKLGVAAPAVNVTVHNNAGAAISVQQDGNNIDVIVARAVEASRGAVARDVQRGGTPISRAIERTYGTNRSAGAY